GGRREASGRGGRGRRRRATGAAPGSACALRRGRGRGEGDEGAAALHRGDAPLRDGDGREADRRRGAARGDEGQRPRHARDARGTVEQIAALDKEKLRPERVEIGTCPRCGQTIRENSRAYGCTSWKSREEPGCGFVIWKRVASRTLTPEVARQLLEEGRTREVMSGFRSRNGKPFRARLVLNGEGKIEFEFPARSKTVQPTAAE